MRSDTIRIYKTVHTWTGIVSGLALFIAFYAGAVSMFKDTLAQWVEPPVAMVRGVPLDRAASLIEKTLAAYPDARRQFTLKLTPAGGDPAASKATLEASLAWQPPGQPQRMTATLDATGQLAIAASRPSDAARFIDILHMTAGIPGGFSVGMGVMGVISLLYGLALVSGVIVLLPTLVKDLFALRIGKNLKRMWLDAHNVVGILSLPFHVVMALSVVGFGLNDYIFAVQDRAIYSGTLDAALKAENPFYATAPAVPGEDVSLRAPSELLAAVKSRAPGFMPEEMSYRGAGMPGATVFIGGSDPRALARSGGFALMDPVSGRFLNAQFLPGSGSDHQNNGTESNGNVWSAITSAVFALHFGSYGGEPVRWGYFFLGLAGAFLFYSGNLLWIESRRKAERRDGLAVVQRRSTYWMASLTVGVTLGCIGGISATLVAGKLLAGHVADMHAWHAGIYYFVFLISIAWAMLRGASRAAVELLLFATLGTAAIPLASLIGWLAPSTGLWFNADTLGVDAIAALGAACFAWMMRATSRRVSLGRQDSVWAKRKPSSGERLLIDDEKVRG
jgi:uncharacterized iron-regulated membrane protein